MTRLHAVTATPTVVFDTNVFVAELAFPAESPDCVALAETGSVEAATTPTLLREFAAVLARKQLPLADRGPERRARAVERAAGLSRVVDPAVDVTAAADPDDDAVLECALAVGADVIVSNDSHLRDLGEFAGADVLAREAFLTRYADSG